MNGEEFGEELYRENLYFVYEDKCRELEKELDKFRPFTSAYEMKKEIKRLNNIIKELRKMLEHKVEFHKNLDFYEDKELETQAYYNYVACLQDFDEIVEKYKLGK